METAGRGGRGGAGNTEQRGGSGAAGAISAPAAAGAAASGGIGSRAGVVHGNTGRAPKHRLSAEQRERIVELRLGQYRGFNDQHFTDKLGEEEQLEVSRATVRRVTCILVWSTLLNSIA